MISINVLPSFLSFFFSFLFLESISYELSRKNYEVEVDRNKILKEVLKISICDSFVNIVAVIKSKNVEICNAK